MDFAANYIREVSKLLASIDQQVLATFIDILQQAHDKEQTVFVFGNGGSSATAAHLVNDLVKGTQRGDRGGFRAMCLSDNVPTLTAFANDVSYEEIFVGPMRSFWRPGDVAMGISASGNSPNVLRAIEFANAQRGVTLGLCGFTGGRLKGLAQHALHIPANHYGYVEDLHAVACHIIGYTFMERAKRG